MGYLDTSGLTHLWQGLKAALNGKQDKLAGAPGQVVGFDAAGNAVAQSAGSVGSGGSAGEVYSSEEQVIGSWIDGKPLYRRVFKRDNFNLHGYGSMMISEVRGLEEGTIENIDQAVRLYGTFSIGKYHQFDFPYILMEGMEGEERYLFARLVYSEYDGVALAITSYGSCSIIGDCIIIVEYTKTTD